MRARSSSPASCRAVKKVSVDHTRPKSNHKRKRPAAMNRVSQRETEFDDSAPAINRVSPRRVPHPSLPLARVRIFAGGGISTAAETNRVSQRETEDHSPAFQRWVGVP